MSDKNNVLAVMDNLIADTDIAPRHAMPMREARAAVAELIEADLEYDEAQRQSCSPQYGIARDRAARVLAAKARRAAALARINGAA